MRSYLNYGLSGFCYSGFSHKMEVVIQELQTLEF